MANTYLFSVFCFALENRFAPRNSVFRRERSVTADITPVPGGISSSADHQCLKWQIPPGDRLNPGRILRAINRKLLHQFDCSGPHLLLRAISADDALKRKSRSLYRSTNGSNRPVFRPRLSFSAARWSSGDNGTLQTQFSDPRDCSPSQ